MIKVGVIGGSGLESMYGAAFGGETVLDTPFGAPSSPYRACALGECLFYFLSRHGDGHVIPPHSVNYRANIYGFRLLGVTRIVAFSAVGGINPSYGTGSLVLAGDAMDFTGGRASSFYDEGRCVHVDLTCPFCPDLREDVKKAARLKGAELTDGGVYLCVNGPRFETAAEIKMFAAMGADMVGMTMFPEASLAREAEICYASVSVVTNPAAGVAGKRALTADEVIEAGAGAAEGARNIIGGLSEILGEERGCRCKDALQGSFADK